MPLREDLLNPIPGDNPGGENLWYDSVYDQIKEARREEDDFSAGVWQRERKVADWNGVIRLAGEALATRSKDLQLAAWLTEALVKTEGCAGLRDGLVLIRGLIAGFWDHLYPPLEEGDSELRLVPLDWIGGHLDRTIKLLPITKTGLNWFDYKQALSVGREAELDTEKKRADYAQTVQEGKVTGEQWDEAFKATPKDYYQNSVRTLDSLIQSLDALDTACREKFGENGPSFGPLRSTVEEIRHLVNGLWLEKRESALDTVAG